MRVRVRVRARRWADHAKDEGEALARAMVPVDQGVCGEARDDCDDQGEQGREREHARAQGEAVVEADAHLVRVRVRGKG